MYSSKNSDVSNNDLTCLPTSSSTYMSNSRVCSVCSGPSNGFYFGVLSCRACASFYRRSFFEQRRFLCRRFNNCDINAGWFTNKGLIFHDIVQKKIIKHLKVIALESLGQRAFWPLNFQILI